MTDRPDFSGVWCADFEDHFALQLTTDGRETLIRKGDLEIRTTCMWEGASLLFCSRFMAGGFEAENVVTYTLSADGRELVADERYSGLPRSYHNQWVLVRVNDASAQDETATRV